jgi:hypothetical protein
LFLSKAGLKKSKNYSWNKASKKTLLVFEEAFSKKQGNL